MPMAELPDDYRDLNHPENFVLRSPAQQKAAAVYFLKSGAVAALAKRLALALETKPDFTLDLQDADLEGCSLWGAPLGDADLRRANLTDADLRQATLTNAVLVEADLTRADLREADLRGADLTGADLRGAKLRGADFTGAVLTDVKRGAADPDIDRAPVRPTRPLTHASEPRARMESLGLSVSDGRSGKDGFNDKPEADGKKLTPLQQRKKAEIAILAKQAKEQVKRKEEMEKANARRKAERKRMETKKREQEKQQAKKKLEKKRLDTKRDEERRQQEKRDQERRRQEELARERNRKR